MPGVNRFNAYDAGMGGIGGGGVNPERPSELPQIPSVFHITDLTNDPVSKSWVATVKNLPAGWNRVPLPFTNEASLQTVMRSLIQLGHVLDLGGGN